MSFFDVLGSILDDIGAPERPAAVGTSKSYLDSVADAISTPQFASIEVTDDALLRDMSDALSLSIAVYNKEPHGLMEELRETLSHCLVSVGLPAVIEEEESPRWGLSLSLAADDSGRLVPTFVVAFRGSSSRADWEEGNFRAVGAEIDGVGVAHSGFVERARSIPRDVAVCAEREGWRVCFAGHSLGGGAAQAACLEWLCSLEEDMADRLVAEGRVRCVTFGAPAVFGRRGAELIRTRFNIGVDVGRHVFVNVVNTFDVVTTAMGTAYTMLDRVADTFEKEDEANLNALGILTKALTGAFRDEFLRDPYFPAGSILSVDDETGRLMWLDKNDAKKHLTPEVPDSATDAAISLTLGAMRHSLRSAYERQLKRRALRGARARIQTNPEASRRFQELCAVFDVTHRESAPLP